MAEPMCPECKIEGVQNIASADSADQSKGGDPWFQIAYCKECGHVYGVFAKIINGPTPSGFGLP